MLFLKILFYLFSVDRVLLSVDCRSALHYLLAFMGARIDVRAIRRYEGVLSSVCRLFCYIIVTKVVPLISWLLIVIPHEDFSIRCYSDVLSIQRDAFLILGCMPVTHRHSLGS